MALNQRCIVGNWKMNGSGDLIDAMKVRLGECKDAIIDAGLEVIICPPATLIARAVEAFADIPVSVGAQDCHKESEGAHTGDVSAALLAAVGAESIIIGHSERRQSHGENSEIVAEKFARVRAASLTPIVCVGETAAQRDIDQTAVVVNKQVTNSLPSAMSAAPSNWILAYEPIWAIGTGKVASREDIETVVRIMRDAVGLLRERDDDPQMRILYGGSANPKNTPELLSCEGVDGLLIGGASLDPNSFAQIVLDAAQ